MVAPISLGAASASTRAVHSAARRAPASRRPDRLGLVASVLSLGASRPLTDLKVGLNLARLLVRFAAHSANACHADRLETRLVTFCMLQLARVCIARLVSTLVGQPVLTACEACARFFKSFSILVVFAAMLLVLVVVLILATDFRLARLGLSFWSAGRSRG